MKKPLLALFFAACAFGAARADVALAPLFADHAVLQRDRPILVWGHANPGEKVSVDFGGKTVSAEAGPQGRWAVVLDSLPATSTGADLVVTGTNRLVLHDVVVGEVWLCSGQSNMEFVVDNPTNATFRVQNADAEVAAARFPLIRQFKVARRVAETAVDSAQGAWVPCSPETAAQFTAVGYFFAREIHERLSIPVGLINSTWGGTPIESWMPPEMLAANPAFALVGERWRRALADYPAKAAAYPGVLAQWQKDDAVARSSGADALAAFRRLHPKPRPPRGPGDPWTPSGLFNGMIEPLLPYRIRGVLWYQGESNSDRANEYHRLFAALITGWRSRFGQGDLPFYWVQLAAYRPPSDLSLTTYAFLREAQTRTLSLPATGMAVTIDIGDPDNIHPRNKQEVGRRLALIAKSRIYGIPEDYSGPTFLSAEKSGSELRLRFDHAATGLTAGDGPLQSFELAGADRRFWPAIATIAGDQVLVSSPEVPDPVAVRYGWSDAPRANLYNGAGLPAVPFRTDNW